MVELRLQATKSPEIEAECIPEANRSEIQCNFLKSKSHHSSSVFGSIKTELAKEMHTYEKFRAEIAPINNRLNKPGEEKAPERP